MRELARMGYQSHIITSDSNHLLSTIPILTKNYLFEDLEGVKFCWIRTFKYPIAKSINRILSWLHFEWKLWRLPKAMLCQPTVVIISSLSLLTILNGLWFRKIYKCRLIFEVRDIWPLTLTEEGGLSNWNPLVIILKLIERIGYRFSDAIVGTMPNLREHVRNVIKKDKLTYCIPMGVELNENSKIRPISKTYLNNYISTNKFIVAYAGTIGITNALDTFFDCAESMKGNLDINFLIVGDGALLSYYKSKYGHLRNLTFVPKVSKKELQSVLAYCDLLYFSVYKSAVWKYGQSLNKLIDYMLAGKPILASYTGYKSMINEAGCGTFVPAEDTEALRSEIQRYKSMSKKKRDFIGLRGRKWILANRNYKDLAAMYLSILFPSRRGL